MINVAKKLEMTLGILLIIFWIVAHWLGPIIIEAIYNGNYTWSVLDRIMNARNELPLDYYLKTIHRLVNLIFLLTGIVMVSLYSLQRQLLAVFLVAMIIGDLALVYYSYAYGTPFSIFQDGGIAEFYGYGKEIAIGLVFLMLYRKFEKGLLYAVLSGFAFWLFVDDAFRYHERVGGFLADSLNLSLLSDMLGGRVREQDIGELIAQAFAGSIFLVFAIWGYVSSTPEIRKTGLQFGGFVVLLGIFGVVLDILDRMPLLKVHAQISNHIEDGGELVVMSLMLAFVVSLLWRSWRSVAHTQRTTDSSDELTP